MTDKNYMERLACELLEIRGKIQYLPDRIRQQKISGSLWECVEDWYRLRSELNSLAFALDHTIKQIELELGTSGD